MDRKIGVLDVSSQVAYNFCPSRKFAGCRLLRRSNCGVWHRSAYGPLKHSTLLNGPNDGSVSMENNEFIPAFYAHMKKESERRKRKEN
jgi:hypothetical protein